MQEQFEVGCNIILQDIISRPQLNGESGVVQSFQHSTGRYVVKVRANPAPMLFKPANLRREPNPNDGCGTPLMEAIWQTNYDGLVMVLSHMIDAQDWVDRTDPKLRITPLIACAHLDDESVAVKMACLLLKAGAKADTPDSVLGVRPVFSAAQEGKPNLIRLLVNRKANVDQPGARHTCSTPIVIASQNGHAECVAVLLKAGLDQGLRLTDATNRDGKTPALIATERAHVKVLGVLAQGLADLRVATPTYYCTLRPDDDSMVDRFDPSDDFPVHRALDMAVRSHVGKTCCGCGCSSGDAKASLSRCEGCKVAYFCSRSCLKSVWKKHKLVCKDIAAGRELLGGWHDPHQPRVSAGFEEPFGSLDEVADVDNFVKYDREVVAKWEYDAGERGRPDWRRYPARIEDNLESMSTMDFGMGPAPKFMYRPGYPDNDGRYENHGRSIIPPPDVATRYVTFDDMTEREVYSGASRPVRRNGVRQRPPLVEF